MFKFQVIKPKDTAETFSFLRTKAAKHNIKVNGDERSGNCSGYGFAGSYEVGDTEVNLTITKMPVFITKQRVIRTVNDFLEKYA